MLLNESKKTVLAKHLKCADTFFTRLLGLMGTGKESFVSGMALLIKPCKQVHTFLMRFPIDVIFIDKNNLVIKTVPGLRPYRASPLVTGAAAVIELPRGTIEGTCTTVGDKLKIC
ncbi:DUF192 domain-containing protein [Desulfotruncus alcoholivorax]|uniref:DUF192 domain-containing protein n=1 Tax=Desulfotruncus alcoholivorax TaxID=265477 RepID=UPI0003F841A4|nr:DUF192 domain-containing protein [Desulfotruncus alcoholivorax]